jgi:hypothetical protein
MYNCIGLLNNLADKLKKNRQFVTHLKSGFIFDLLGNRRRLVAVIFV